MTLSMGMPIASAARDRTAEALVVVDTAVAASGTVAAVLERSGLAPAATLVCAGAPTTAQLHDLAARLQEAPMTVVGVGGGAAMDTAALAAVWASDGRVEGRCGAPQRSGLIVLPDSIQRTPPLVLVPTTIGTGAEASRSACFVHHGERRLVLHDGLRPDEVLRDPLLLDSLPVVLVREALLEVLFRLSVLVLGATGSRRQDDADLLAAVREVVRLGEAEDGAATRSALALASARSHSPSSMAGADPYSGKAWYLATEAADLRGERKVAAMAALLPVVFALIAAGRRGWGDVDRLERFWSAVREESSLALSAEPASGLRELLEHWGVRPLTWTAAEADVIARRAVRRWGGGLPMLFGLRIEDIRELLAAVTDGTGETRGAADRSDSSDRSGGTAETD